MFEHKICSLEALALKVVDWKTHGYKIVFTNGCFDIIHPGHVTYLHEAKQLGDKLIVGVNSDESVKKLKGNNRPIQSEWARSLILSALESVDAVVIFNEDTPYTLIEKLMPNVLVKGGDYTINQIIGADIVLKNGGSVKQLKFLEGYSTSAIEKRIKANR